MTLRIAAFTAALLATPVFAQPVAPLPPTLKWSGKSEALIARPDDPWITPAERDRFERTPRYAEVRSWLERLDAASPLIEVRSFGKTAEGRDLLYVRASKGGAGGSTGKPVMFAQAGIHAGEIDGKDAGLMLLRDIALKGKDSLLDKVDLVFVPIFNIDGHEQLSQWNRPHQRGPFEKGHRSTARNINLNRDYAKADAPEMRAMLKLLRALDPALYIDLHVSDGFDHQYDVTFTYAGWGKYARNRATADWLEQRFDPAVKQALSAQGHIPSVYPSAIDARDSAKGIRFSPEGPRYSTGYGDFIGVPTVLVENHSLKPYRQRVLGAYVLLEAALKLVANDASAIAEAKEKDRAGRPAELMTRWKPMEKPIGWIEDFKGVAYDTYESPASGRKEQRWLARPITYRMPIIGQAATQTVKLPRAWWIPAGYPEIIERLELHGIEYETTTAPRRLTLDRVHLDNAKLARPSEGRVPMTADYRHALSEQAMPAGSVRVPVDQPRGLLAAALLEPESQDSFFAWGFFPEALSPAPDSEDFVVAPMADRMLESDPALRQAFEAKLAADPEFAADPDARLAWFYERSPYADRRAGVYPIARETDAVAEPGQASAAR